MARLRAREGRETADRQRLRCLRQVEREMTPAIARDARPGGPTAKRQPSPEGLGNQIPKRGSERRRCGGVSLGEFAKYTSAKYELSSRPERSEVESLSEVERGPAVLL